MTDYTLAFVPEASRDLRMLDRSVAQRILNKLRWLSQSFDHLTPETLTGEFKGLYRLRVGSYRVIYTAHRPDRVLTIHVIGHRRSIYDPL